MTIWQGLINGGTACYLADNAHEDYSSHKLPDKTVWKILTFELNHLTLLATEIIRQVGIGSNVLNPFASALFFITPITLLFDFLTRESPLSQRQHSFCKGINQIYMIATIISSITLLALGNVGYAISSLAFIAINALVQMNFNNTTCKKIFSWVNTSCAALAFVGYGAWIISCGSLFAKINFIIIAIELIIFKIWNLGIVILTAFLQIMNEGQLLY